MESEVLDQAVELLEKANAELQPELLTAPVARELLAAYAKAERLAAFGVAALARKLDDASELARVTGTSVGSAKAVIATAKGLGDSEELSAALQHGDISLDQAAEIASAEESAPGAAAELVAVAQKEPFHVLKEKSRKAKLEAEQHKNLAERQRAARSPAAIATSSACCTSTSLSSPTSMPPSSTASRQRPSACIGPPERGTRPSPLSTFSPMPTLHCSLLRAAAAPGD